jgi:1-deoxy-D-xylulose-5-phosphate reductoisomerase
MRNVVILGATGSIGRSARKVAKDIPSRMRIVGMSAHANAEELAEAAREFPEAKTALSSGPDGVEQLVKLATMPEADLVLIAIVGTGGLRPALAAIEAGKDIAVASKEIRLGGAACASCRWTASTMRFSNASMDATPARCGV